MVALETRHLSILLTDIKGFTDKTSNKTRADIQTMLDEHRAVVLPLLESGGGRLIKTIGDAFLMTFESPTNAVLAGVAVQEALAKRNEGRAPDDRLEIRIAINAGEINLVDGDVFGEPVNITSRIEGIAEAGQVYFTEAVYLAMNKAEVPSSEVGLMQLKGIPEKIRVYKVRREDPVAEVSIAARERTGLRRFLPSMSAAAAPAAPAAFGPDVKAVPVSATMILPSPGRRAAALAIDALICSLLLGSFGAGSASAPERGRARARAEGRARTPGVAVGAEGVHINAPGARLAIDDNGIHGSAGDVKVSIDETGVHVESGKPGPTSPAASAAASAPKPAAGAPDQGAKSDADGSLLGRVLDKWDFAVVWAIYNLVFLKWLGASPGKRVLKLRVVSMNGQPPDKRQRTLRAAFSLVSGYALFLGYVWALWEPQRRTWHDLVAGTRVVPAE